MPIVLRSSPTSPFGRKIKLALAHVGLKEPIEVINADTFDANDPLRVQNPLGKIPVLIMPDGSCVYDSRVILEQIDIMAGGGLIPRDPKARIAALTLQSLADGMMDAGILQRYEIVFRTEDRREPKWISHQADKVARALAAMEGQPPSLDIHVGTIAFACALGYLDFRFGGLWRADHPKLVTWLNAFTGQMEAAWDRTKPPV